MRTLSTFLLSFVALSGMAQTQTGLDGQTLPLVYDVENTGSSFAPPVMPVPDQLPVIHELPDALEGVTTFADWARRRSDIGHMIHEACCRAGTGHCSHGG